MALNITRALLTGSIYAITVKGFVESGTATSGTATTLTDTSKTMTVNAYVGRCLQIHTGYGEGALAWVSSNGTNSFVVEAFYLPDFQNGVTKITPNSTSQWGIIGTDADVYAASVAGGWGGVTKTGDTYYFSDCLYIGDGTIKTGIAFTSNVQFGAYGTPRAFASAANTAVVLGRRTKTESTRNGISLLEYCTRADSSAGANFGSQWDDLSGYVYVYGSTIKSKKHESDTATNKYAAFYIPYKFDFLQSSFDSDGLGISGTILGSFYRCNITNGQGIAYPLWLYSPNIAFNDVYIYASYQGLRIAYNYNGTLRNCSLIDNIYPIHLYGPINDSSKFSGLLRLINTQVDLTAILVDTYVTGTIQKEYEWSINVNDGSNNISGAKIYVTDATGAEVVNTSTDASGNIATQEIVVQKRTGYAGALLTKSPHVFNTRKYGYRPGSSTATLSAKTIAGEKLRVDQYVVASSATAAAMTGITISALATSLSSAHTLQEIYDRGEYLYEQSNITEPWTTSDGVTFSQSTGRVFTPGSYLTYGSQRIVGGTIAFGTPGALSPRLGAITIRFTAAGTYVMGDADFGGAVVLTNTSGGAVTVELPAGVDYTNTGPSITVVEPQIYQSITVTGGVAGTTVQIFDLNGRGELANLVPTSWPYIWTDSIPYSADIRFRVRAGKVGKLLITQEAGTATLASPSVGFLLAQTDATVYNSKGIDGSTVTGISIVDGTLTIELSGGTLVSTPRGFKIRVDAWKIFAYASWWETTEEGIRDEVRTVDAPDGANIRIYTMGLKNTTSPSYTVEIYGAYVVDALTGYSADLNDPSGGNISYAPDHVVVQYVDLAPGSSVVTGDISSVAALVQTGLTAQGLTTARAAKLDKLDANVSSAGGATALEIRTELAVELARIDAAVSSVGGASVTEIEASNVLAKEATVASRLATSAYTAPDNAGISAINTRLPASPAAVADVQVSGGFTAGDRLTLQATLAAADYVAPDNAGIAALPTLLQIESSTLAKQSKLDSIDLRLPASPAAVSDVHVTVEGGATAAEVWANTSRTLTADPGAAAHATTQAEVASVKVKTDALTITSGNVHANVEAVNGQPINGTGTESDPWGPA